MPLKRVPLGRTGLTVSELCFGALPGGPVQKGLSPAELGPVIARALRGGVDFIDGAHVYGTYAHIAAALAEVGPGLAAGVRVASKSSAADPAEFRGRLEEALAALGRKRLDICYIHGSRSEFTLERYGAVIEELGRLKAAGKVRLAGVSTHRVSACRAALGVPELDVVMPIANLAGLGIADGTVGEMLAAIAELRAAGKGLVLMKALGGGALLERREEALRWARENAGCHAVAVGMVSADEVDFNLAVFAGRPVLPELAARSARAGKRITVLRKVCERCGRCVAACPVGAMRLGAECAEPDTAKCTVCGYCLPECPRFALRMT
jgi:aryl-alcohol dehydrogenase-like predicted oxidoreductase